MADYTTTKAIIGAQYLEGTTETNWHRLEPLITVDQLKARYLFGIPLVSALRDPITHKPAIMQPEMIKDIIYGAVSKAELATSLDIFPTKINEKKPLDKAEYEQFGYFKTEHRPVASIEQLSVTPANNSDIFIVPLDWIETAYLAHGQINIVPLMLAINTYSLATTAGSASAYFLSLIGQKPWIPAYWMISYTAGYEDGLVPRLINDLVGTIAAIQILSQLAATYAYISSTSLSIDGMSQSVGTPGPQMFALRIQELEKERDEVTRRIKAYYGTSMFSSNV